MKLLSVANVGTLLGGTGACAWTCVKALPDWEHVVLFRSGGNAEELQRQFGCTIVHRRDVNVAFLEEHRPDVILFHNTPPEAMPHRFPDGVVTIYYQHSAFAKGREARRRCDAFFAVSKHLARQCGIREEFVLYQPVPRPKTIGERKNAVIGRLCTAGNKAKWQGATEFYHRLYAMVCGENLRGGWEFVGLPENLRYIVPGAVAFDPSWEARSKFSVWDAMLYSSPVEESYGRTVCEAQRAGCIPIVDNRGGFIEQIEHGRTGFLCSNVDEFADAAARVIRGDHGIDCDELVRAGDARGSIAVWRRQFLAWVEAAASMKASA